MNRSRMWKLALYFHQLKLIDGTIRQSTIVSIASSNADSGVRVHDYRVFLLSSYTPDLLPTSL